MANEEPSLRDEGCNGRDQPNSSLSISTDPTSDRASESLIKSSAIAGRLVSVSIWGLLTLSIVERETLVAIKTGSCGEEEGGILHL